MTTATDTSRMGLYKQTVEEAACELFSTTCGLQLQLRPSSGEELANQEVIIGIISLTGQAPMSVVIGMPRSTASTVSSMFAGFDIPYESPDMGDAVGELANMLAGIAKRRLSEKQIKVDISLPMVMRAESIQVLIQRNAVTERSEFSSPKGPLWTGIAVGDGGAMVT